MLMDRMNTIIKAALIGVSAGVFGAAINVTLSPYVPHYTPPEAAVHNPWQSDLTIEDLLKRTIPEVGEPYTYPEGSEEEPTLPQYAPPDLVPEPAPDFTPRLPGVPPIPAVPEWIPGGPSMGINRAYRISI